MTAPLHWQKSTFSDGGDGNTCIELAVTGPHLHLRESDDPTTELATTPTALAHLLQAVKATAPLTSHR
ncbi:DUF397 domain-containing protein [Streptomyces sp. NPDC086554]|uniref:DUF397 domain-containing protein n=1 Tax=Streptomyces sp. NPDC086554 TaxID=3154864 RepID=UPI00341B13BD